MVYSMFIYLIFICSFKSNITLINLKFIWVLRVRGRGAMVRISPKTNNRWSRARKWWEICFFPLKIGFANFEQIFLFLADFGRVIFHKKKWYYLGWSDSANNVGGQSKKTICQIEWHCLLQKFLFFDGDYFPVRKINLSYSR